MDLKSEILAAIDMDIINQTGKVSSGGCVDMKEYGDVCGQIKGLSRAKESVKKAFNKLVVEEE